MKTICRLLLILSLPLLPGLSTAQAETCTDPSIPPMNPDSAYIDHGDGTVNDIRSGLMWKRCAEGQTLSGATCIDSSKYFFYWNSALKQAVSSRFAGYSDWRLPNIKELYTLVEGCRAAPSINDAIFPSMGDASGNGFISGSFSQERSQGWGVDFYNGTMFNLVNIYVRLVRGGQSFASFDRLADPAAPASVIEFYNTTLDNYFITSDPGEAAAIDGGSAGPGWIRTGNTFKSGGSTPVCRFYGSQSPGPNSHFYTVDPGECASLVQIAATTPATQPRWNLERRDFVSTPPPANGTCPSATLPVYRAFNGGYPQGVTPNHRITSSLTAIQQVVAHGWHNEGIVMCAPQ